MAEYATDEEQVEAIKKWWDENGIYLVGGIVVGLALLFGWNYWKTYRVEQGQQASAVFAQLVASENVVASLELARLQGEFGSTPYPVLAELMAAKTAVSTGDLKTAESVLRRAIAEGDDLNVSGLARIRLARVLLSAGQAEEALKEAESVTTASFLSLKEETRGDALVELGRLDDAREAYDRALLSAGGRADFLQLKRDDLGMRKAGDS